VFWKSYYSKLTASTAALLNDYPTLRDSTTLLWFRDKLADTVNFIMSPREALSNLLLSDSMTLDDVKKGYVRVLEQLKAQALQDHDTNITFAIVSVPGYFNSTLRDIVKDSCQEVGIETSHVPFSRMKMSSFGVRAAADTRYLVLDQDKFYLDIGTIQESKRSKKPILQRYLPLDPFGSAGIDKELAARIVDASDVLQDQLALGADRNALQLAIGRARFLIRDSIDAEIMGKDMDADHHHDEWPLDLSQDWWVGEKVAGEGAVLHWKHVQAAEDQYVDSLSTAISGFLVASRRESTILVSSIYLETALTERV
jgi:hypothetical protein